MVRFARKNDLALVFGLEHIVNHANNDEVSNIIVTVLPYKTKEGDNWRKKSFILPRLKNHFAPKEEKELRDYQLKPNIPDKKNKKYNIFKWKGLWFSVYNCFELTDLKHRGLMRGKVDFLATIAWNQDIIYFDKILSSSSRDLQAYIIYANTSQYGGSTVIAPKRNEDMEYVKIKGGIAPVLLKSEIDIKDLRDFQIKSYDQNDKRYKPLPGGFESDEVKERIESLKRK